MRCALAVWQAAPVSMLRQAVCWEQHFLTKKPWQGRRGLPAYINFTACPLQAVDNKAALTAIADLQQHLHRDTLYQVWHALTASALDVCSHASACLLQSVRSWVQQGGSSVAGTLPLAYRF